MQVKPFLVPIIKFTSLVKRFPADKPPSPAKMPPPPPLSMATANSDLLSTDTTQTLDKSRAAFQDYQQLFVSQRLETAEPVTLRLVDGTVPMDFPAGTYYLAGPGLFIDDYGSRVHPLDGHGYLRAFTFEGKRNKVRFMARYVRTEAQMEEHDAVNNTWHFTHRGPFSVLKAGKKVGNMKVMKNVANTNVVCWGGRLLCFWEGGEPYEIRPGTLHTVGKYDLFDGYDCVEDAKNSRGDGWDLAAKLLKPILSGVFKMHSKRFLSHYKIDALRNRLLLLACNTEDMLLPHNSFTFYEFDSKFELLQRKEFKIPDHLMIHDWAFTNTYYILFANRIKLDILGSMAAVSGLSPMISALSVNPSKPTSSVYLLPRSPHNNGGGRDWTVPIEVPSQLWLLHFGNAYENRDENGVTSVQFYASACSYRWFHFHKLFGYNWRNSELDPSVMNINEEGTELLPRLIKASIDLDTHGNGKNCSVEPANQWKNSADFPVINPTYSGMKNSVIYAATTSGTRQTLRHFPFDTVVKLNASTGSIRKWSTSNRRFIGEPIYVPKGKEEDDGYILVVEYAVSIQKCYLVILNPKRIGEPDALIARLEVPRHLSFPLGFHGFWAANT